MIETLCNATVTEAGVTDEVVRITGITFEDGNLSKARYPTLIDYCRAPGGVRFEPGFQILLPGRYQFLLQLEPGFEFTQELVSLNADSQILGLEVDWSEPSTCLLSLDGVTGKVAALRLPCRPTASGRILTPEEIVYGGAYLAIISPTELGSNPIDTGLGHPGEPEQKTIKILGSHPDGQRVYDLFRSDALPSVGLSLEPTFRVRAGEQPVEFAFQIATPIEAGLRFVQMAGDPQQVQILGVRPPELQEADWLQQGDRCKLVWVPDPSELGQVSSFSMEAKEATEGQIPATGERRNVLRVDPTVIQPPSCTGGICI